MNPRRLIDQLKYTAEKKYTTEQCDYNSGKSHLLLSHELDVYVTANINGDIISNSKSEELLGLTVDYKLTSDEQLS